MTRKSRVAVMMLAAAIATAGCDFGGDSGEGPQRVGRRPRIAERDNGLPPTTQEAQKPGELEAKMRDFLDKYGSATRPRDQEVPRIDSMPPRAPVASDVEWGKANPGATTQKSATTSGATTAPAVQANAPATLGGATTMPAAQLPELDALISGKVARDPRDLSAVLDSQLLRYLRDEPVPDPAAIAGLQREDQQIVSAVMDALNNFRITVRNDPNAMYKAKTQALSLISDRLRGGADLSVPVIKLASAVRSYGDYDPLEPVINSNVPSERVVYFEVKDFRSELLPSGMWETRLSAVMAVFDDRGTVVWQQPPLELRDLCRNARTDFFVGHKVTIRALPPGKYTLRVTLTDVNHARMTEAMMKLDCLPR